MARDEGTKRGQERGVLVATPRRDHLEAALGEDRPQRQIFVFRPVHADRHGPQAAIDQLQQRVGVAAKIAGDLAALPAVERHREQPLALAGFRRGGAVRPRAGVEPRRADGDGVAQPRLRRCVEVAPRPDQMQAALAEGRRRMPRARLPTVLQSARNRALRHACVGGERGAVAVVGVLGPHPP